MKLQLDTSIQHKAGGWLVWIPCQKWFGVLVFSSDAFSLIEKYGWNEHSLYQFIPKPPPAMPTKAVVVCLLGKTGAGCIYPFPPDEIELLGPLTLADGVESASGTTPLIDP